MKDSLILDYVSSTAALLDLALDEKRCQSVASHFQRTAAMAAMLDGVALVAHDELAEIYCPAPFPANEDGRDKL